MYDDRMVIPQSERLDVLRCLHQDHLAIIKCRERAEQLAWWAGMTQQIAEMVRGCQTCRKKVTDVAEPLKPIVSPPRPRQHLGSDLFYYRGSWYQLVVDYYSHHVEAALLEELNTRHVVVLHMKSMLARHSIIDVLASDNGPNRHRKNSECAFQHVTPRIVDNQIAPQER